MSSWADEMVGIASMIEAMATAADREIEGAEEGLQQAVALGRRLMADGEVEDMMADLTLDR